mmetsp:Transcript_1326/g.2285  ORF Transcript_1326/g.2285 Transcript_1326/m.2285 type:complete len:278 (-) Transcript_1326:1242-2075(-)
MTATAHRNWRKSSAPPRQTPKLGHLPRQSLALRVQTPNDGGRQTDEARPIPLFGGGRLLYSLIHQSRERMLHNCPLPGFSSSSTSRRHIPMNVRVDAPGNLGDVIVPFLRLTTGQVDGHGEVLNRLVELYPGVLGTLLLAFVCHDGASVLGDVSRYGCLARGGSRGWRCGGARYVRFVQETGWWRRRWCRNGFSGGGGGSRRHRYDRCRFAYCRRRSPSAHFGLLLPLGRIPPGNGWRRGNARHPVIPSESELGTLRRRACDRHRHLRRFIRMRRGM